MAAALPQPYGADVSHVIDSIYMGAAPPRCLDGVGAPIKSYLVETLRVGFVVNMCVQKEQSSIGILPGVQYYQEFTAHDHGAPTTGQNFLRHICKLLPLIDATQKQGKAVFIHCGAGRSRSATLVLGILLARYKMSLRAAWDFLRTKRPSVYPQPAYFKALQAFEKEHNPTLREPTYSEEEYKRDFEPD